MHKEDKADTYPLCPPSILPLMTYLSSSASGQHTTNMYLDLLPFHLILPENADVHHLNIPLIQHIRSAVLLQLSALLTRRLHYDAYISLRDYFHD